jgi:predicted Zn-dependent protease
MAEQLLPIPFMKQALMAIPIVLLLAACGSSGSGVNQGDFNLVSLEEEWQLGNQLAADIARQMPLVNDSSANAYVNRVGRQIVSQTEMAQLPWNFHIVNDPSINAFNIPGGHVYVTTGLIAAADNASEFAGVMAHEISHGVSRHGTEQLTRTYGLNIIAALLLGQNPAVYQQILAQIIGSGTLARFSRSAEEEADNLGVRYMHAANYDPRGMVTMFEELLAQRRGRPGSVEKFFSTHPLEEDRIRSVSKAIQGLPAKSGMITNEAEYQELRRRVGAS